MAGDQNPKASSAGPRAPGGRTTPVLVPQGVLAGQADVPLDRPVTTVGSNENARLHLVSRTVSKGHAIFVNSNGSTYVADLASRTGVLVNGKLVRDSELKTGDRVQIGKFVFRYRSPTNAPPVAPTPQSPAASIIVVGSPAIPASGRTVIIGRRENSDVSIPTDTGVSASHSVIFQMDGRWFIRDLGSRTGTLVNGTPIHQKELQFGDRIVVGSATVLFQPSTARVTDPEDSSAPGIPAELPVDDLFGFEPELIPTSEPEPIPATEIDDAIPLGTDWRSAIAPEPVAEESTPLEIEPEPVAVESAAPSTEVAKEIGDIPFAATETAEVDHAPETDPFEFAPEEQVPAIEPVEIAFAEESKPFLPAVEEPAAAVKPKEPIVAAAPVEIEKPLEIAGPEPIKEISADESAIEFADDAEDASAVIEPMQPIIVAVPTEIEHPVEIAPSESMQEIPADESAIEFADDADETPAAIEPIQSIVSTAPVEIVQPPQIVTPEPVEAIQTSAAVEVPTNLPPPKPIVVPAYGHLLGDVEDFVFVPDTTPVDPHAVPDVMFWGDPELDPVTEQAITQSAASPADDNQPEADNEFQGDDGPPDPPPQPDPISPAGSTELTITPPHDDQHGSSADIAPVPEPRLEFNAEPAIVVDTSGAPTPAMDWSAAELSSPQISITENQPSARSAVINADAIPVDVESTDALVTVGTVDIAAAIIDAPDPKISRLDPIDIAAVLVDSPDAIASPAIEPTIEPVHVDESLPVHETPGSQDGLDESIADAGDHFASPMSEGLGAAFASARQLVEYVPDESVEPFDVSDGLDFHAVSSDFETSTEASAIALLEPHDLIDSDIVSIDQDFDLTAPDELDFTPEAATKALSPMVDFAIESDHQPDAHTGINGYSDLDSTSVEPIEIAAVANTRLPASDFAVESDHPLTAGYGLNGFSALDPTTIEPIEVAAAANTRLPASDFAVESDHPLTAGHGLNGSSALDPTTIEPVEISAVANTRLPANDFAVESDHPLTAGHGLNGSSALDPTTIEPIEIAAGTAVNLEAETETVHWSNSVTPTESQNLDLPDLSPALSAVINHTGAPQFAVEPWSVAASAMVGVATALTADPIHIPVDESQPQGDALQPINISAPLDLPAVDAADELSDPRQEIDALDLTECAFESPPTELPEATVTETPPTLDFAGVVSADLDLHDEETITLSESMPLPVVPPIDEAATETNESDLDFLDFGDQPKADAPAEPLPVVEAPKAPPELVVPETAAPAEPRRGPSLFGFEFEGGSFLGGMPISLADKSVIPELLKQIAPPAAAAAAAAAAVESSVLPSPAFDARANTPSGLGNMQSQVALAPTSAPTQAPSLTPPRPVVRPSVPPAVGRSIGSAPAMTGLISEARSLTGTPVIPPVVKTAATALPIAKGLTGTAAAQVLGARTTEVFSQLSEPIGVEVFGGRPGNPDQFTVPDIKETTLPDPEAQDEKQSTELAAVTEPAPAQATARKARWSRAPLWIALMAIVPAAAWFAAPHVIKESSTVTGHLSFVGLKDQQPIDLSEFIKSQQALLYGNRSEEIRTRAYDILVKGDKLPPGFTADPTLFSQTVENQNFNWNEDKVEFTLTWPDPAMAKAQVDAVLLALSEVDANLDDLKKQARIDADAAKSNLDAVNATLTRLQTEYQSLAEKAANQPDKLSVSNNQQDVLGLTQQFNSAHSMRVASESVLAELKAEDPTKPINPETDKEILDLENRLAPLKEQIRIAKSKAVTAASGTGIGTDVSVGATTTQPDASSTDYLLAAVQQQADLLTGRLQRRRDELAAEAAVPADQRAVNLAGAIENLSIKLSSQQKAENDLKIQLDQAKTKVALDQAQSDAASLAEVQRADHYQQIQKAKADLVQAGDLQLAKDRAYEHCITVYRQSPGQVQSTTNVGKIAVLTVSVLSCFVFGLLTLGELRRPKLITGVRPAAAPRVSPPARVIPWPQPQQLQGLKGGNAQTQAANDAEHALGT